MTHGNIAHRDLQEWIQFQKYILNLTLDKYKIIWFLEDPSNNLAVICPSSSVLTFLPPPHLESPGPSPLYITAPISCYSPLKHPLPTGSFFTFLVPAVIPGYIFTSEALELRTTDKTINVNVFLYLGYLTHIFFLTLLISWLLFFKKNRFSFPLCLLFIVFMISLCSSVEGHRLFPLLGYCE